MVTQTHYFVYFTVRSYGFDEKPNLYKKEKKERKCLGFFIYVTELADAFLAVCMTMRCAWKGSKGKSVI